MYTAADYNFKHNQSKVIECEQQHNECNLKKSLCISDKNISNLS